MCYRTLETLLFPHQRSLIADHIPDYLAAPLVVLEVLSNFDLEVTPTLGHEPLQESLNLLLRVAKPTWGDLWEG